MLKKILLISVTLILLYILAACSKPDIVKDYTQMCKDGDFSDKKLEVVVLNLNRIDWYEYSKASQENKQFISVFMKLEDYKFNEETLAIVFKLPKSNPLGLDGMLSEEYMGLIGDLYSNNDYKFTIDNLAKRDKAIADTLKVYELNYGESARP